MPKTTDVNDVFRLVGNETRSRIMQVLWKSFDFQSYVTEDQEGLRFGDLRERADVADPGNFNYHLRELDGTLVEDTGSGYVLTPLGYNLMRAIERLDSFKYTTRDPWVVDEACPGCRGTLVASYRREMLEVRCDDCGGLGGEGDFTFVQLPVTNAQSLDTRDLLDAATLTMNARLRAGIHGRCWQCHSSVSTDLQLCDSHTPDESGVCPDCSNRFHATIGVSCTTCGTDGFGPAIEFAIISPPVQRWFQALGAGPGECGPWSYRIGAMALGSDRIHEQSAVAIDFDVQDSSQTLWIQNGRPGLRISTEPPE